MWKTCWRRWENDVGRSRCPGDRSGERDWKSHRPCAGRRRRICGLYIIAGFESSHEEDLFYDLLDALSYSGIGGKRRSGFGRFEIESIKDVSLSEQGEHYMTLSVSLPEENEMEVLRDASYQVIKRGGFVGSEDYSDEYRKKKDLFMVTAGSCFHEMYSGNIYDVSNGGKHAVYRYGKPIFWAL